MKERLDSALKFYLLTSRLTTIIRSGWNDENWDIQIPRRESVAEHVFKTCMLAFSLDSQFETHLDMGKVAKMIVLHEIGESIIGDITPFDKCTPEEKMRREHLAWRRILGDLIKADEYYELLLEFDAHETKESIFAYHCDKLEADLTSKYYQDMGYHKPLDKQENNITFKSAKIQKMVEDGAKTAFDIWYLWDRPRYLDDPNFLALLDYVYSIDFKDIIASFSN